MLVFPSQQVIPIAILFWFSAPILIIQHIKLVIFLMDYSRQMIHGFPKHAVKQVPKIKNVKIKNVKKLSGQYRAFWVGVAPGGVFHPPSITHLFFKSDYSDFVQNYFGINEYLAIKRIRIKSTMTSL